MCSETYTVNRVPRFVSEFNSARAESFSRKDEDQDMPPLRGCEIKSGSGLGTKLDSTVLTVLKWWMITTLNRKLLESRGYKTTLLPMRYRWVTMSMLLSVL